MTLKECYEALGGDYNDAMSRLYDENFIKMFVLKFPDDKNYENLIKYLDENNHPEAFRAAHTLKGVALNLSFSTLADSCMALTDSLRSGSIKPDVPRLLEAVTRDYNITVNTIIKYREQL